MKSLGPFQAMPMIIFPLFIKERIHNGLLFGVLEEFVGFCSLRLFQCHVQTEFAALYWILCHGWLLRRWRGSLLPFANPSLCTNSMLNQYLVNKITLRDNLLARGKDSGEPSECLSLNLEVKSLKFSFCFIYLLLFTHAAVFNVCQSCWRVFSLTMQISPMRLSFLVFCISTVKMQLFTLVPCKLSRYVNQSHSIQRNSEYCILFNHLPVTISNNN